MSRRDLEAPKFDAPFCHHRKGKPMRYCHDKQINKMVANLVRDGWKFSRGK